MADESRTLELKKTTGGFITVTFKRPTKPDLGGNDPKNSGNVPQNREDVPQNREGVPQNREDVPQNREGVPQNVPQSSKELLQDRILEYISGNSTISREEIVVKLEITSKTVGRHLAQMGIFWKDIQKPGIGLFQT